jgi:leader peptidase (prepilin peptidase) / N-methyltransferase
MEKGDRHHLPERPTGCFAQMVPVPFFLIQFHFAPTPDEIYWAIAIWLLVFGAAVGSFLNVVIYRLPAGKSIVFPGSHCPLCGHAIRWYDNIPLLSWILLGGHCRDCRAPISIRYPLVEAGTAALFVGLAARELLGCGGNLPPRGAAPLWSLPELLGIYAYQMLLLCTLLAAAMITYDGGRVRWQWLMPTLVVGFAAPLLWPQLHPVHVVSGAAENWFTGLIDGAAGLIICAVAGWLAAWLRRRGGAADPGLAAAAACIGVMLGWQALCAIMTVWLLVRLATGERPPWNRLSAAWLGLTTFIWLLAWAQIHRLLPWL